jgi:ATP-dependent metalloprotease
MQKLGQHGEGWAEPAAKAVAENLTAAANNNTNKAVPKELIQQIIASRGQSVGGAAANATIASGSGIKGNPIYVVVEEGREKKRKGKGLVTD